MVGIEEGELKEIAQLVPNERIIIKGGPLRMGHSRQEVANGNAPEYPAGLGGTVQTGRDGPVWCLATESDVTLEIDPEGFALVDTFRSFLGIDESQSLGNQPVKTASIPAEGVLIQQIEDDTDIPGGQNNDDVSITADPGEVWQLNAFDFFYSTEGEEWALEVGGFPTSVGDPQVEFGFAEDDTATDLDSMMFRSGEWVGDHAFAETRGGNFEGRLIDEDTGVQATFANDGSNPITGTRRYGFLFRRLTTS